MANTVIQLKKSGTPSSTPADLANGEIAINYADGKLFYKDVSGNIQEISGGGGPSFATINVAGTLIIPDAPGDVLTINNGENIELSSNIFNDSFTITANITPAFDQANAANVLAYNTGIGANSYTVSVGTSGNNYAGYMVNAANSWANTKLSNTDNVVFNGTLRIANTLYANDVVIANSMIANISGNVTNLSVTNNVFIGGSITNVTQLIFNTSTNLTPTTPGALSWSQDDSTLHFDMDTPGNVIAHIGQDLFYLVKNQTGSSIAKGTAVRFAGTLGASGRLLIAPAIADNSLPSKYIMGVAADTIANGDDGFVITQGKLRKVDTSMFSEGDILYLSSTTAGSFQNTSPTAPNNKITMAAVVNKDNINGVLQIRVTLGSSIREDELAEINGLAEGDILYYVNANGRFENKNTLVSAYNGANAAYAKANAANVLAYNTGIGANVFASSVGVSANAYAASLTPNLQPVFAVSNAAFNTANAAFGKANTSLQNTNVTMAGNLTMQGNTTLNAGFAYNFGANAYMYYNSACNSIDFVIN